MDKWILCMWIKIVIFQCPLFYYAKKKNNLQLPMLYFYRSFPKQNEINPRNTKVLTKIGFGWITWPGKAQCRDLVDLLIAREVHRIGTSVGWKVASGIGPNLFQALFFYLMNLTFWKMPKYSTHWKVTSGMLPNHFHYWNATFWKLPKYIRCSWEHNIVGTETSFEPEHKLNTKHSHSY